MKIQTARTLAAARTPFAGSFLDMIAMNATLDAYHASRVAAGHRAAATRKSDQSAAAKRSRYAERRQAGIRAALTRKLNAERARLAA